MTYDPYKVRRTFRDQLIGWLAGWGEVLLFLLVLPFGFLAAAGIAWVWAVVFTTFYLGGNLLVGWTFSRLLHVLGAV